ncbi:hypothetical protein PV327_007145 [Microctonus hyperodae]|uniref:Uncharacterized protein n=1 Tax=Microctonus hyperodae TaxID=165561 RepID=A0AA39F5R9_MICHY|nr:hypothetical protein PV327_007145 [Microctonus hyperodae]
MALRQAFRTLFKRCIPVTYGVGLLFAHCDENKLPNDKEKLVKLELPNVEKLSFDYLIKHSVIDTVNSTSQALTVVYSAIESTSKEYRALLSQLMSLMEDTLIYEVNDEHQDMIIAARCEMQNKKKILGQLIGHMDYIQRMAEAVTIVSHSAGMDNLAMTLCERMDDAIKHKDREILTNKKLEQEYFNMEERCVKESQDK